MGNQPSDIERTRQARDRILEYLRTHPNRSCEELARSGLYTPMRAKNVERSAKNWARTHVLALLDEGLVERIDDRIPHRFRVVTKGESI